MKQTFNLVFCKVELSLFFLRLY